MLLDLSERKQEHLDPLEVKARTHSQSPDQVHVNDAASATHAHAAGLFKKLQTVTLIHLASHLALPTDRKEHLRLRALSIPSVLQGISYAGR